jgi:hypothetical protein
MDSFVMIAHNKAEYFSQPDLFGPDVASKFPAASVDLAEAGKCFSAERYTACVFHLMRVMEVGLVRLAKRFNVKGVSTRTWGEIIGVIAGALRPKSKRMQAKYGPTVAYFRGAKDGWRDRVCHSNASYSEGQAKAIFLATEGFMVGLAALF